MFDAFSHALNNSGIFDKFKNVECISEELCLEITSWNKEEFVRFSKCITSVRDTNGRTTEQLIALYMYWLKKGLDQATLAMLKCKSSQQEISHYLAQIREAINSDFVPFYLGANQERQFFLGHNNSSVKEIHQLKDDELAIVVDASYIRIEKSANNKFQYLTYSSQKLDNLMKPFIICCADGYIIDCYGPFQANMNDASIFDYILVTDPFLPSILLPSKTHIFLDRGEFVGIKSLLLIKCYK